MGVNQEIACIENFYDIYLSRNEDYRFILTNASERKILIMHIGGILLECLVKSIIIRKYGITKKKKNTLNLWYNDKKIEELESVNNTAKQDYAKKALIIFGKCAGFISPACSGHDFPVMIREFLKIDTAYINDELDFIFNPLCLTGECFIDLRYHADNDGIITDELFERWKTSFNAVHRWLDDQMENVSIEDY